ncbi:hypothetical protein IC607_02580 [Cellulomonas sp. JH27-2]|uniref:hypothetical protein n=1 Tax=Cellulomonas sp. JH27-2 TaxID=2774139 RepID=UPI00178345A6|nr:hypothetical protein [Cellulomonas sp. JH27-2]MBD8057851.1 hypothetical protein [Cellulomonas sp. JH27-2]
MVVAGLPIDGELRIVGRAAPLSRVETRELAKHLHPPTGTHPWPATVKSATVNGFGASRDPVDLTLVEPVVVEVSADAAWSGTAFRHLLRYVRVRPELYPEEVSPPPATA